MIQDKIFIGFESMEELTIEVCESAVIRSLTGQKLT